VVSQVLSNVLAALSYVFATDGLNNVIWRSTKELCDDRELVDVVLSREQRLAFEHFRKDAACTPDINFDIVFLPCEHNFWCAVVAGRNVSSHLGILYTGQAKIADFQIAVLVHEDVARLQVTVDDTSGVDVFQATLQMSAEYPRGLQIITYQDLVEKVLDELLL